jgi:oxygen-independent coproporphyrinogen-3 oxidase
VYFHVPFCRAPRCAYCDFYSTPADSGNISRWYAAAQTECRDALAHRFSGQWIAGSVFFGGGTPSLLTPEQLGGLIELVRGGWGLEPGAEITAECNPENVTAEWTGRCREAGVNRLSLGVQSFDPEYLKAIGRCHRTGQAEQALESAAAAGFQRISADLILGGPGSAIEIVTAGVERALELGVEHLSVYGYHLDPPAAGFGQPRYSPLDDDAWSGQYLAVCELLSAKGWRHYEISNWARDDSALCAHNLFYWRRLSYLGVGPSAHSFGPGEIRVNNRPDLDAWLEAAGREDFSAVRETERLDRDTILFERVMLGLRLDSGVELALLEQIHGTGLERKIAPLLERGLAVCESGHLRLTDTGLLLYDTLTVELAPE